MTHDSMSILVLSVSPERTVDKMQQLYTISYVLLENVLDIHNVFILEKAALAMTMWLLISSIGSSFVADSTGQKCGLLCTYGHDSQI